VKIKNLPKIRISKSSGIVLVVVVILAATGIFTYQHYRHAPKTVSSVNSSLATTVGPIQGSFNIEIAKIGVSAPVIQGVDGRNETTYDKALEGGVAQFKGTYLPGEGNNIFIFGHSSANKDGLYAKIFANLNDLTTGDQIKINFNSKEHDYTVKSKKIVEATDLSSLNQTKNEQLTLMTCWPIGTDQKRLIVIAKPN
jgi:LPXTG-site transpeptidase (sortase) family protein